MVKHDKSFFQTRLQRVIAKTLFPSNQGDWFESKGYKADSAQHTDAFDDFVAQQRKPDGRYFNDFKDLDLSRHMVSSVLATKDKCQLEVMTAKPELRVTSAKPGTGKHIVYFPGADTYYQACFRDVVAAAKETGANVHAFNFPGTGASTGKVLEANDLVNAGLAVVRDLVENQGVHIDDIILQGDCYGSAIAYEVKKEFKKQSGLEMRVILNNAFSSFESAVRDMITNSWIPSFLSKYVGNLLEWIGWNVRPADDYQGITPYQCHIQHCGDQTLRTATLSSEHQKRQHKQDYVDPCPEEFKQTQTSLAAKHMVRVKPEQEARLAQKFGRNTDGCVNGHFADLCELEMLDGKTSVYEGYINEFLTGSNQYIQANRQSMDGYQPPKFLGQGHQLRTLSQEERENFQYLHDDLKLLQQTGGIGLADSYDDVQLPSCI